MTTDNVDATLRQIAELTAAGGNIVRVAVPGQGDADALAGIAGRATIPVSADSHVQPRCGFAATDAGCAAIRVNAGDIKEFDGKIREIAGAARDRGTPNRLGVNAGSLDPRRRAKHGKAISVSRLVNGPGEARDAGLCVAGSNGKRTDLCQGQSRRDSARITDRRDVTRPRAAPGRQRRQRRRPRTWPALLTAPPGRRPRVRLERRS